MIRFKEVEIYGFGSIVGPLVYKFKPGLNLIKADNGYGKTTIFNAWFWGLTGDTLKPGCTINTWPHVQPPEYLGTKVRCLFYKGEDKYEIIRCNNYLGKVDGSKGGNRLMVIKNGKIKPLKGIKANQQAIDTILGYSPNLLKNTLVFGQKLKRLIDESGTNKKEILEQAFDMAFIIGAQDKTKDRKKAITDKLIPLDRRLRDLTNKLDGKRELLKQALENEAESQKKKEGDIIELELEASELESKIDLISNLHNKDDIKGLKKQIFLRESELNKVKPKRLEYDKLMSEVTQLNTTNDYTHTSMGKLETKIKDLDKITSKPLNICPTCKEPIGTKSRKEVEKHYKDERNGFKEELEKLNISYKEKLGLIKSKTNQLASLKQVIDNISSIEANIKKLEKEINSSTNALNEVNHHKDRLNKVNSKLESLKSDKTKKNSTKIKLSIRALRNEVKPLKELVKGLTKELDIIEWLIKDPLSNSGLKAFIFRDMIHKLNEKMVYYGNFFDFKVEFEVDMDSSRKDIEAYIIKHGEVVSYRDLSGGQAQSVAVVISFALHDIVSINERASNILIMDEIFEGLSRNNVEKVNDIIGSKPPELSIHLITHRNEFNPYNSKTTKVYIKNGITHIN